MAHWDIKLANELAFIANKLSKDNPAIAESSEFTTLKKQISSASYSIDTDAIDIENLRLKVHTICKKNNMCKCGDGQNGIYICHYLKENLA